RPGRPGIQGRDLSAFRVSGRDARCPGRPDDAAGSRYSARPPESNANPRRALRATGIHRLGSARSGLFRAGASAGENRPRLKAAECRTGTPPPRHYTHETNGAGRRRELTVANGSGRSVLKQLQALFDVGTFRDLTDGQLLERFAASGGETAELALTVLV